jgi:parallel beta-helix repeat protein
VKIFNSNNNAFGVSPADNSIEEAGFIIFDSKFNVIWGSASKNKMEGFKFLNVNNSRIDIWQATDNGIDNVVFSDSHDNLINIFNASNSLSGSGVRFRDSDFNEIQIGFANSNKMNGIVLYGSKFNQIAYIQEIKQNTLSGIQLMRSNKNIVYGGSGEDTGISKNEVGISLLESHKNIIGPVNSSANNGAGVQLRRSHNNSIAVLHTFVAPKEFPWVMPSGTQGITSLSPSSHFASNAYGISISHSSGNVIQDSVIAENIVKGIKIENKSPRNIIGSILHIQGINRIIHNRVEVDANETVISDNLLEGSGILIYSTRNLIGPVFTVFGNSISGDIRGIDISGNSNLVFRNRIFENNYGIYLYSGASTILENSIHDNLWGMRIVNSVNTSLIGVRSVSNEDGITLSLTNDSKIERSFICSNSVDIRNESSYGIKGFRNFCDRTENWNDINETLSNVSGCSFVCPTNLPPEVRFLS